MRASMKVLLLWTLLATLLWAQSSKKGGLTGWDYFKQKRYDVALELLKKDARLYPQSHEIHDGVGWCYFFLEDLDQAEASFKKALKFDENYRYSKMGLESVASARLGDIVRAESLLDQGRYREASAVFDEILEKRPKVQDAIINRSLRGRGYANYYLGLYQKALKDLQKANRLSANDAVTSAGIGFVQLARKKYSQADIAFEHAFKLKNKSLQAYLSYGWSAYYSGNATTAVRRFEKASSLFEDSWGAVYGMAWSYNKKKNPDKAKVLFRQALDLSPNAATADLLAWIRQKESRSELLVNYGFALTELGQYLSAQQIFRSTIANVDRSQMLLGDALCALNQGDNLGALRMAKSLLDRGEDPQRDQRVPRASDSGTDEIELSASSVAGWAHLRLGDLEESAQMFQRATSLQGQWADALVGLGYVRMTQKNYFDAEIHFQKAIEALPTYASAQEGMQKIQTWRFFDYTRAQSLVASGDLATAKTILASLRQDPAKRFPPARTDLIDYELGHIARLESKPKEARALFQAALKRNPKLSQAGVGLGWSMVAMGEYDEAVKVLQKLLDVRPTDPEPRRLLVRSWVEWDRAEEAFSKLAEWVKEFPADKELNDRYGRMLIEKKCRIEARICFASVLAADPNYIATEELEDWFVKYEEFRSLYGTLGWAFYNRGQFKDSTRNFRQAMKYEPGASLHKKGLALSLSSSGEFDDAEKISELWEQTQGKTTAEKAAIRAMDMTLGWDLYGAAQYKRALKRFQRVEKRSPSAKNLEVDLLSALGWTWLGLNKPQRSREFFLAALAKQPRLETATQGLEAINKLRK